MHLFNWPFHGLDPGIWELLMIDPPWRFETFSEKGREAKSADVHYQTMRLNQIAELPVKDLMAPNSLAMVWTTNPLLPQQLEIIQSRWGLRYVTIGTWVKRTVHWKLAFGTGYVLRNSTEHFVIAARGKPKTTNSTRSVLEARLRKHSEKPDEIYPMAERLMPSARMRADIFSRTDRKGWTSFGDEKGLFNDGPVDRPKRILVPKANEPAALPLFT